MPNETIHISLGPTANHISSHLLNLQGLAATRSGGNNHDNDAQESLCDPTVTHDISPVNDSIYGSSSSRQQQYVYVPRMLVVDGRNSFGDAWGAVGSSGGDNRQMANAQAVSCWNGPVSIWNSPHDESAIFGGQSILHQRQRDGVSSECIHEPQNHDPLDAFRTAASALGLSSAHSRYVASAPSYNHGMDARHVAWDDDGREQEDEDDDVYGYDQERMQEEKRRRMEKIESRNKQVRNELEESMANVWEQTFYADSRTSDGRMPPAIGAAIGQNSVGQQHADDADVTNNQVTDAAATTSTTAQEREIHWHDYLMPPRPSPSKYQIPLPFDTAFLDCNSFAMGYRPARGVTGDNDKNCGFGGVTQLWRENALSESLRKVLEGCDEVKGFNLFVDGGQFHNPPSSFTNGHGKSKLSKQLPNIMAGGGLYAGLATSILEELHDECRSAGRWTVLVDPPTCNSAGDTEDPVPEFNQVQQFRRQLNAGLSLHGLSANSDTFLPLSLEGAHRALFGERVASQNRLLFEGSAAIALALEASTLFYRLRRNPQRNASSMNGARSRLGIQSGFYRGFSGNSEYGTDNNNDPFASATSLTYHEFLACTKSSSDRRRSVLELDAMLRPLSYPMSDNATTAFGHGSGLPSNILASLLTTSSSSSSRSQYLGQLHQRMMKGTTLEQMQLDQDRNFRSRKGTSARQTGPGEWLEDSCTGFGGGGGLLNSLSGHGICFGRRSDHHHFALSSALRPSSSDTSALSATSCCTSAFIRPMMESMGAKYRPGVTLGVVVKDTVADLTGIGSYWTSVFRRVQQPTATQQSRTPLPQEVAHHTSILSVLGNSTRSYPRVRAISTGFVDSLHSRKYMGYLTRDEMAGIVPAKDDCEEALEYCRELVDVYEPPLGSGLVDGEDENDLDDAYFDEH
ncbi:hypothetical protein HJC23_008928 [Cyclotella cryptica]|uniref:Misato Segment II tubulin-like domain-containing protein n=1 Tax=Cyclotella cryptica TaxID=29204 RepID=A0ABD3Q7B5_9STRA|eukprot:CCRYP_009597-RA/>CCRYP_009597-RA protein AED:0.11 eAED:0.11 QI:131/-1/1/1/-1/1/1/470/911